MFSSNQIFEISGELCQLENALRFALNYFGKGEKSNYRWQTTDDGKYCIGWGDTEGWNEFQFDFDAHIVSEIIGQYIKKMNSQRKSSYDDGDGAVEGGFLMKAIPETFSDEYNGIKKPFYGIVSIEPFECYYSK